MKVKSKYRHIQVDVYSAPKSRTDISERPTIPYVKVFKSTRDKASSRQARKAAIRQAKAEY